MKARNLIFGLIAILALSVCMRAQTVKSNTVAVSVGNTSVIDKFRVNRRTLVVALNYNHIITKRFSFNASVNNRLDFFKPFIRVNISYKLFSF